MLLLCNSGLNSTSHKIVLIVRIIDGVIERYYYTVSIRTARDLSQMTFQKRKLVPFCNKFLNVENHNDL